MTIGSSAVTVQSVSLARTTWCTSSSADVQCSETFAGIAGTTNVLEVSMQYMNQPRLQSLGNDNALVHVC